MAETCCHAGDGKWNMEPYSASLFRCRDCGILYEVTRTDFGSISRFYRAEPREQERRHAPFPDILR